MRPVIKTYTGRMFPLTEPTPDDIDIEDIAQGLSNLCRYSGQCRRFYSIAEHCINVSKVVPEEQALHGLMHDAAEAYVNDLTAPLKWYMAQSGDILFQETENKIMEAIAAKFGFPPKKTNEIHEADMRMFSTEATVIMTNGLDYPGIDSSWILEPYTHIIEIHGWEPRMARLQFMARFRRLMGSKEEE